MKRFLFICMLLLAPHTGAHATLSIFACEPEWAALAKELGGDRIEVFSATTAQQDVHHIQARPSLIAKLRRADLLVCTGSDLEVGWLPILLRRASNPNVLPGTRGYLEAAHYVPLLEKPEHIDRSQGDVHPQGNPHIHLDPRNIAAVAEVIAKRLSEIDPQHQAEYQKRHEDFATRWRDALTAWEKKAAPLQGVPIIVHHNAWVYLSNWLGLKVTGVLEPKPGVPPSSTHLGRLLDGFQQQPANMIIRAPYQSPRASDWLSQRTGAPVVMLPYSVGGSDEARDIFGLFDDTIQRLLDATS